MTDPAPAAAAPAIVDSSAPPTLIPSPAAPAAPPAADLPPATPDQPVEATGDMARIIRDPEWAAREFERLRSENGRDRVNAKKTAADEARAELLQTLTQALDPEAAKANQPMTLEQVAAQLQTATSERDLAKSSSNDAARELAIVREAWKQGVDVAKLEYLAFTLSRRADLAAVSADSDDFGGTLSSVISDEISKDQSLRASGAHRGTGAPQFGGAAGVGAMSKTEFDAMPYAQRVELYTNNRAEYDRLINS
jgi:hypothetical protein